MSRVGDFLRKIAAKKNTSSNSKALGSIILKPSEATPSIVKKIQSSGGSAKVVSGSMSSQIPSGNIQQALRSSSGGGALKSSSSNTKQQELIRLTDEIRKRDQARQQEVLRIQNEQERRRAMILAEKKRQEDISRLNRVSLPSENVQSISREERKRLERRNTFRNIRKAISGRVDVIVPPNERGLIGLVSEEDKSDYIEERTPFASGQGTSLYSQRQKTFFEKINVNPNSKPAKELKKNVTTTQNLLDSGRITESQAEKRNAEALTKFQSKQMIRGLPRDAALGAGFVLLQSIPVVGQVSTVALGTDLLLKRKAIAKQFKEFPLESVASVGAFAVGGRLTTKTISRITSLESIKSGGKGYINIELPKGKKTPLSNTFPKEVNIGINDVAIKKYVSNRLKRNGVNFNKLNKIDQKFITGQVKARIINNPLEFIPPIRRLALQKFLKQKKAAELKALIIKRLNQPNQKVILDKLRTLKDLNKLSKQQRLSLERFQRNANKQLRQKRLKDVKGKREPMEFKIERIDEGSPKTQTTTTKQGQILIQRVKEKTGEIRKYKILDQELSSIQRLALKRLKQAQRKKTPENIQRVKQTSQKLVQRAREKFKQKERQVQREIQKIKQKQKQVQRQIQRTKQKLAQRQRFGKGYLQLQRQLQKLNQRQLVLERQIQRQNSFLKSGQAQISKLEQSLKLAIAQLISQRVATKMRVRTRTKTKQLLKKFKKKKPTPKRKISKKPEGYNVFVKSRGKFRKANQKPLSEIQAKDRAAYIVDHSTAVTARIVPLFKVKSLGKIRPQEIGARTKIKARTYRIKNKRKVELYKTIIEKRGRPRINTRGEKRGLTAARLVKQLNDSKKKTSRKTSTNKRTLSREALRRQRLKNLEKARRVRTMNSKPNKRVVVQKKRTSSGNSRAELLRRLEKARRVRAMNLRNKGRR